MAHKGNNKNDMGDSHEYQIDITLLNLFVRDSSGWTEQVGMCRCWLYELQCQLLNLTYS